MALSFTLDSVAAPGRARVLERALAEYSIPLELHLDHHSELRATFETVSLGGAQLEHFAISGASGHVERPETRTSGSAPALMTAHVLTAGSARLSQNGRTSVPRRGEIVLSTTELPFSTSQRVSSEQRTFSVTYDDLRLPSQSMRGLVGCALGRDHAIGETVAAHLVRVSRGALAATDTRLAELAGVPGAASAMPGEPGASPSERAVTRAELAATTAELAATTIEMLRALVLTAADLDAREPLALTLADRVMAYLTLHAADPALTPSRIANEHHISLRYLYVILGKREIVLGDWLRERRLQLACRMLEDASLDRLTVSGVAQAAGFADHPHFTRSFRRRYDMTPSEWRQRSAAARNRYSAEKGSAPA